MRAARKAKLATCLLAAATTCGCAETSPWGSPTAMNAPAPAAMTTPGAYGVPPGGFPAGAMATPPGGNLPVMGSPAGMPAANGMPASPSPSLPTQPGTSLGGPTMLASLQRAKDAVGDALRIQPHVTPAPDPVRLNNEPLDAARAAADLHYHAGRVFETQNNLEFAAGHYRDALANRPDDVRLLMCYARVNDRLGRAAEAEAIYRRAIELAPNHASCYNDLAMCQARHGQLDLAQEMLQHAVRLEPANKLYRNNLALVLVDAGRPQDAFDQLAIAHGEAAANYNLGYMLLERGGAGAAETHFRRALELNPQLTAAQQMLDELQSRRPPASPRLGRLPPTSPSANFAGGFRGAIR